MGLAERAVASRRVQEYNGRDLPSSDDDLARLLHHIEAEPWNPILHGILGHMRMQRREHDEACAAWIEAISRWGESDDGAIASLMESIADARLRQADTAAALLQYEKAAAAYQRAYASNVSAIARDNCKWRAAYCLVQVGQVAEARELMDQIRRGPNYSLFEAAIAELERFLR